MREIAVAGLIAFAFGLGSYHATRELTPFTVLNLAAGALALAAAALLALRRLRFASGSHSRRVLLRGLLGILAALALAVGLERAASWSGWRADLTFEHRYELAPATRKVLAELPEVRATLYHDRYDPRARNTRLLLGTLARAGRVDVRERLISESPREVERYGIATSNSVVLEIGDRFELVERPLEATLYEALYRLRTRNNGVIGALRGEGEGDLQSSGELGFSGLASALDTEGYQVKSLVTASLAEIPDEVSTLLVIAPRRALLPESIAVIERYLEGGGRLLVMLEPGTDTGLEELLALWGIEAQDGVIVDPASGGFGGEQSGTDPVVYNYETHPLSRGLDPNRMTFFSGVRSLAPHGVGPEDKVQRVALASSRSWLSLDPALLAGRGIAARRDGEPQDYHPVLVAGRYPRNGHEARIVAFGDSDFASNRYLRTLYNLDLVLNAVHWVAEQEAEITLRPKLRTPTQFPLPIQNTLKTFQSLGLLIPELLLLAGALVWIRQRAS
jgi:hypothetical protein